MSTPTSEECGGGGNTLATSCNNNTTSTPLNWWYNNLHATTTNNSSSSWDHHHHNAWNSSSSCEEDISVSPSSFTNASNHSTLTVESSRNDFMGPPPPQHASDHHLWSHLLNGVGTNGEQEIGENFVDALSCKSMRSGSMFEPACDYLKKLDTISSSNCWDQYNNNSSSSTSTSSLNSFEKQLINGFSEAMMENNERLTKLSNLVSTWSIAPPDSNHFAHPPTNNNNSSSILMDHHYPQSDHFKQYVPPINSYDDHDHDQDMNNNKVKQEYHHHHASDEVFGKSPSSSSLLLHEEENNNGFVNSLSPVPNLTSFTRNFSDVISFNNRLGRPVHALLHKPINSMKYFNLSEPKKQSLDTSQTRSNNGRDGTTREVKKKRSEESSEATLKKAKQDTSTASSSSSKVQAPKVKLGDKITALQQIVSPFGKTDTASVLFEAIGYIKFLQEQVQLLSNPYLKTNSHKDPWGRLDRREKEEGKGDLRSRGLCLVPTSCTPLVYRDNSGPDYWTPAYRGCLYR